MNEEIRWRKSQYSNPNGACVEVGDGGRVRDTKQAHLKHRTVLTFGSVAWQQFITEVKGQS